MKMKNRLFVLPKNRIKPITQSEIDEQIQIFISKGGRIQREIHEHFYNRKEAKSAADSKYEDLVVREPSQDVPWV